MVQVLNRQNHSGDFGDILGASLGHVISQAAEGYVGAKANQIKTQSRAKMFEQSGYTPEEARILGSIQDEGVLGKLLSTLPAPNYQPQQYGQPQAYQNAPGISPYPQKDPSQFLSELEQTPQGQKILETLGRASQKQKENLFSQFQQPPGTKEQEYAGPYSQNVYDVHNATKSRIPGLNSLMQAGTGEQGASSEPNRVQAEPRLSHGTSGQPNPAAQGSEQGSNRPRFGQANAEKEARANRKEELELKKYEQNERVEAFKLHGAKIDKSLEEAAGAKNNLKTLNRVDELEKEGKLDTPGYIEFLKRSGLDIPALMDPSSEEFGKITTDFLRDAKNYYGGRVTNTEMEQFLKLVPSLSQSPEGRKRVAANMRYFNEAKLAYADTMRDIIRENKNVPPLDLNLQIYDRIDDKLDKLADQFKENLSKPVPEGQNKLITALQAGAGSLLGGIGGVAKGAAKGAVLGGLIGGPAGALTGGVAGGAGLI